MSRSAFRVSHLEKAAFLKRGLRGYFEYRDLGVKRATGGKVVAHVIRARPGKAPHGEWHWHDCKLQFVYVLKGWVLFEYARIRHREIRHSKNLEMIEIVGPAGFKTFSAKKPAARKSPARRSRG